MDTQQANITTISASLCVNYKKTWNWYRNYLSGFTKKETQLNSHKYDFVVKKSGVKKTIRVPILKVENFGVNMAIDEKQIGKEMHTILSNRDTNKIALLARTIKAEHLVQLTQHFNFKGFEVKTITRDLSNTYDWVSRQVFMNASHIADKFHIIKHLLDAHQAVRIRYRQVLLSEKRNKLEQHKQKEKERRKECKKAGIPFKRKQIKDDNYTYNNGETALELLARSRHLLYQYEDKWNSTQKERAKILFKEYPEIKDTYKLSIEFRNWYKKKNVGMKQSKIIATLKKWYKKVDKIDIYEMNNFKSLVERHETIITAYFKNGHTNAIAENINSRIQRYVNINRGTRDMDFFYFRLNNFFA